MKAAWLYETPLILASKSAIRAGLLRQVGIALEIIPASIDERAIENELKGQTPEAVALTLAEHKARHISLSYPNRYVLGVDQVLIFDGQSLSKSVSREIGLTKLREMAGKHHQLFSCAAVVKNGHLLAQASDDVRLLMRELSDDFLIWYGDNCNDALTSSVGGYQFEDIGSHLFKKIEGDYFTTLGLPLIPLLAQLRHLGLIIS